MDKKYKENFLIAGSIAKEVRAFGKSLIKPGASYNQVTNQIRQKIQGLKAKPAFPPQIAPNHIAAHFLPEPGTDIIFSTEVLKLDIGVCYEGAIGDCAVTIDLSGKHQALLDATEAALLAAEKIIRVGLPIREIGKTIEMTLALKGFKTIRNLSGHGLGYYQIHTDPCIPNYDDRSKGIIKPGMTFAIEPFATDGKGMIYEAGAPAIFSLVKEKPARSEVAQEVLSKIKTFEGLPFATHDLIDANLPLSKVSLGLKELLSLKIIAGYAALIEEKKGMVAQAENSVLVDENGEVFISTR